MALVLFETVVHVLGDGTKVPTIIGSEELDSYRSLVKAGKNLAHSLKLQNLAESYRY